jgi:hypothetical protein
MRYVNNKDLRRLTSKHLSQALDAAIAVLKKLDESDFTEVLSSLPQPYASSVTEESSPYFDLPSVLVPPEVIELEGLGEGEDSAAGTPRQEEWPEYRLNLFDNDVSPKLHIYWACSFIPFTGHRRSYFTDWLCRQHCHLGHH